MANAFTKELVTKGKLPFKASNDRLANFGKGFSNFLTTAANDNTKNFRGH